ncbi:MAG: hypothetical protein NTY07_13460 [Bacteroidia bacterium]|nr:hypothetical protein [Bacteroidia bacterium]
MKKSNFSILVVFILIFQSCISLKKHEELHDMFQNQSEALSQTRQKTERLKVLSDSLTEINQRLVNYFERSEIKGGSETENVKELLTKIDNLKEIIRVERASYSSLSAKASTKEVIVNRTDTIRQTSYEINSGKVAFYCPLKMYYKQTYDAYGLIADVLSNADIKSLMINKIKQHERDTNNVNIQDNDLLIKMIQFYNLLEIKLDNATTSGFDIVKVHENDKQIVSDKMEMWHWKVTPITTIPKQELILKVIVYNDKGERDCFFDKTYHLDITVKPFMFFQNAKVLFIEKPEWVFGSIIIPFLAFFIGRYQRRKTSNEKLA